MAETSNGRERGGGFTRQITTLGRVIGEAINRRRGVEGTEQESAKLGCGVLVVVALLCGMSQRCSGPSADEIAATATVEAVVDVQTEEAAEVARRATGVSRTEEAREEEATEVAKDRAAEATQNARQAEREATTDFKDANATAIAQDRLSTAQAEAVSATAEAPTAAPEPPAAPPTEAPPPPPSGPVPDLADIPPDGEPWHPCARGQIKANANSGIYHVPGGASYRRTYRNVWCFNSTAEAEAAEYRRAER